MIPYAKNCYLCTKHVDHSFTESSTKYISYVVQIKLYFLLFSFDNYDENEIWKWWRWWRRCYKWGQMGSLNNQSVYSITKQIHTIKQSSDLQSFTCTYKHIWTYEPRHAKRALCVFFCQNVYFSFFWMCIILRLVCETFSIIAVIISFQWGLKHFVYAAGSFSANVTSWCLRNDTRICTSDILYMNIILIA